MNGKLINTKVLSIGTSTHTSIIQSDFKNTRYTLFGSSHWIHNHSSQIEYISIKTSFLKVPYLSIGQAQHHNSPISNTINSIVITHSNRQGQPC